MKWSLWKLEVLLQADSDTGRIQFLVVVGLRYLPGWQLEIASQLQEATYLLSLHKITIYCFLTEVHLYDIYTLF